jgi:hypothetical protein
VVKGLQVGWWRRRRRRGGGAVFAIKNTEAARYH